MREGGEERRDGGLNSGMNYVLLFSTRPAGVLTAYTEAVRKPVIICQTHSRLLNLQGQPAKTGHCRPLGRRPMQFHSYSIFLLGPCRLISSMCRPVSSAAIKGKSTLKQAVEQY